MSIKEIDLNIGYIELSYETGWDKPVQATIYKKFFGKIQTYRYLAMWDSFEDALKYFENKKEYKIIIDRQVRIGI